jgi:outer membrane protein
MNMEKRNFALLLMIILSAGYAYAQQNNGEMSMSVKEAEEYAVQHNKMVIASKLDVRSSDLALWETISSALPQVSASGSLNDNLKLMTTLLPGEFFGKPGEKIPVTFGSKFNAGLSGQASLLLFNAPFWVGLETTKLAQKITADNLAKSEQDTKESVISAYYLILISEKSLQILEGNLANLNETLKSTRSMLAAGMAEQTDVDQMVSNVTMVENSRSSLERAIELNYNLLRFQLGVPADTKIKLLDNLETITNNINVDALMSQEFDQSKNVNYKLIEGQELLSTLNVKSQKAAVLPTLSGFYTYGTNGMGDKFNEQRWFPNSILGAQISIPIFSSGQRYTRIQKAKINLEKARITKEMVSDQLKIQEKQLRYNLVNANLQYKTQKANVEVSKRVFSSMENKYKQGMASSLDLTQSNTLYLQAENNYVSALMNLLQTKLSLDKLLNNL